MPEDMNLREYRSYAESKYGKKAVNETLMKAMDKSLGHKDGRSISVSKLDEIHGKIKLKGTR